MPDIPGNPNPAQIAAADRQHAAVRNAVTARQAGAQPGDVTAWINLAYSQVVDAVSDLAGENGGPESLLSPALGVAAEALIQLAAKDQQ